MENKEVAEARANLYNSACRYAAVTRGFDATMKAASDLESAAEKWAAQKVTAPILTFTISHPGEPAAGLPHYSDTLTVEVESGNPGGEEGEFAEYMAQCLREWYDGAKVDRREG